MKSEGARQVASLTLIFEVDRDTVIDLRSIEGNP